MSEPIKVGDLVVQVHDCCPSSNTSKMGVPGVVAQITSGATKCDYCRGLYAGPHVALAGEPGHWKTPMAWFKRIPPLSELEDVIEGEELAA